MKPTIDHTRDQNVLEFLNWRKMGYGPTEIAKKFRVTSQFVSKITTRVRDADIEYCGEHVLKEYW